MLQVLPLEVVHGQVPVAVEPHDRGGRNAEPPLGERDADLVDDGDYAEAGRELDDVGDGDVGAVVGEAAAAGPEGDLVPGAQVVAEHVRLRIDARGAGAREVGGTRGVR